jgi:putative peptidoglycan lipid II flippase
MKVDLFLWKTVTAVTMAAFILAVFALFATAPVQRMAADLGRFADMFELLFLGLAGALVYALVFIAGLRIANVKLGRSSF